MAKWITGMARSFMDRAVGCRPTARSSVARGRGIETQPVFEPLEPRLLLSGTVTASFVDVNNTAALSNYETSDIEVMTTTDWESASLVVNLSQGTIYQDASGGIAAPNPALFAGTPSLEFDTSVGGDRGSVSITGRPVDLDQDNFHFDSDRLSIAWANTNNADIGTFDVARITLSDDAVGSWSLFLEAADRGYRSMSGSIAAGEFNDLPPASWPPQAVDHDFTGDGKADIFWHNKRNGKNSVWEMDNGVRQATIPVKRLGNTDWKLAGTGDFTGDGKNDLLWRHAITGRNAVWEMDGTTFVANHMIRRRGSTDWLIEGVGDFTGDGKQDILWRHKNRSANRVWEMDGLTFQGQTEIKSAPNRHWWVGGVADFTGDGKDDILWINRKDRRAKLIWEMDGTTFRDSTPLAPLMGPVANVAAVADYNNDGMADVLWRYDNYGQAGLHKLWVLDRTHYDGHVFASNPDPLFDVNWQPAGSLDLRRELL